MDKAAAKEGKDTYLERGFDTHADSQRLPKGAGQILDFKQGVASIASASEIGEYYQYVIDQKISLPRQKSALLPILNQDIEGAKVSIYNPSTHAKFPLLGLR